MSEALEEFGKLLIQAREEQGLSQQDVADIVDMDVRTNRAINISPGVLFSEQSRESKLKMDRIYRELISPSAEQMKIVIESAQAAKKWKLANGKDME